MIKYNNLFSLLYTKGMKKTDLLEIISSPTLAKLSKNQYVSGEVIDKLCNFLECQPNDIMQAFKVIKYTDSNGKTHTKEILTNQDQLDELFNLFKSSSIIDEVFQHYKDAMQTEEDMQAMELTEKVIKNMFGQSEDE